MFGQVYFTCTLNRYKSHSGNVYYEVLFLLIVLICVQRYEWDYINWCLRRLVVCVVRAKRPTLIITLQLTTARLLVYNYFNVKFSRFYKHQLNTQRPTLKKIAFILILSHSN